MIVMSSADGTRHCDERCYNAKRLKCTCVCGGKNHGLGLEHALERHEAMSENFKKNYGVTEHGEFVIKGVRS